MLGFLRRNIKSCSEDTKGNAYFSMVCSNLEYCSSVWNSHQKNQIRKLEMIQRRSACYTPNRYRNTSKVSSMLDHLQWESLESRCSEIQLTLLYKIVNDMIDIPADEYLTKTVSRTRPALSKKYIQKNTIHLQIHLNTVSPSQSLCEILFQHPLLMPLLWYPSRRGWLHLTSKMLRAHLSSNSSN